MPGIPTFPRLRTRTLRWPGGSARFGPWRSEPDAAVITLAASQPPSDAILSEGLDWLRGQGFASVVTNALAPAEALAFTDAGFAVRERLHLLGHDLGAIDRGRLRTRRVKRRMYPAILELDQSCFDGFWRFDGAGLTDAIEATPFRRVRAGLRSGEPVAYAITGRAGAQGYLQRIGVAPDARRQGWGRALVADALDWLRRKGARRALVNTQIGNEGALALYESCGFRALPMQLCVMERAL